MTNVLLDGFSNYWHRRKSSMKTTQGERPPALRSCPQLRSVPSLWSGIGEQSRSISRGLKINKNSAEREVFLVDFPSYRTFRAVHNLVTQRDRVLSMVCCARNHAMRELWLPVRRLLPRY